MYLGCCHDGWRYLHYLTSITNNRGKLTLLLRPSLSLLSILTLGMFKIGHLLTTPRLEGLWKFQILSDKRYFPDQITLYVKYKHFDSRQIHCWWFRFVYMQEIFFKKATFHSCLILLNYLPRARLFHCPSYRFVPLLSGNTLYLFDLPHQWLALALHPFSSFSNCWISVIYTAGAPKSPGLFLKTRQHCPLQ